jgi:hypothetical protein
VPPGAGAREQAALPPGSASLVDLIILDANVITMDDRQPAPDRFPSASKW